MKKFSLFDKILFVVSIIILGLFLSMKIATFGLKIVMKRFPEIYTEEALNKYGLTKKTKQ
jgi:hypothetical protein